MHNENKQTTLRWKNILTASVGLIAYAYIFFVLAKKINISELLLSLREINITKILILIASALLMICAQGLFLKSIFKIFDLKINFKDSLITWLITIPTGLVSMGISGAAIVFYQAKKKGSSSQLSTILTACYFVLYIFANLLFMLILGGPFLRSQKNVDWHHFLLIGILALLFISLLLTKKVRELIVNFCSKKWPKIFDAEDKNKFLNLRSSDILISITYALLTVTFTFILFILVCKIIQSNIPIATTVRSFIVSELVAMFSPSGSGVGFVELATAGYLQICGVIAGQAGLIVLIYRLFNFWLPVLLGSILLPIKGFKILKQKQQSQIN